MEAITPEPFAISEFLHSLSRCTGLGIWTNRYKADPQGDIEAFIMLPVTVLWMKAELDEAV